MAQGMHLVFEGIDGSGKSSALEAVAELLRQAFPEQQLVIARHPGATPLGAHLRLLNKYPERIDPAIKLDPLSSQLLMVADSSAFLHEVLNPALQSGKLVLSDRSNFITSIAYGSADGLSMDQINRMFSLVSPPRIDRLYVLRIPWQQAVERMKAQSGGDKQGLDRFERKGDEFWQRAEAVYNGLVSGGPELAMAVGRSTALENIKYIDATLSAALVAREIFRDVCRLLATRR